MQDASYLLTAWANKKWVDCVTQLVMPRQFLARGNFRSTEGRRYSRSREVRAAMLAALIVGCLIANQVHAQTGSGQTQSLTRVDCVQAGMAWDEAANVCGSAAQAAEARPNAQAAQPSPPSEVTDGSSQPLTRHECDRAGMAWDDTANVCSEQSDETASQIKPEPEAAAPANPLTN